MSPFIILTIIAILYLFSAPKFRFYIERDGYYLSRSWTSFVNAVFITLVVCSHGLNLFQTSIREFLPEKCAAFAIGQFGQLMVTTFFFYSGYGIMYSLLNRGGYAHKLVFPRFVSLSLNFTFAVMVYFIVHCMLQGEIRWTDLLAGMHEYKVLGNPTWFILMTLLTYVLTFISFRLLGKKSPIASVLLLSFMLGICCCVIALLKPPHWINTILCFPAGMLYYLKGEQIENLARNTKIPSIIYALLLILSGKVIFSLNLPPNALTENIGGVLFALGITWFVGSFSWKSPSQILIWLGGSGLFVVYMFHLLPMRIISTLGLNDGNPYLVWLGVTITAAILIFVFYHTYKHLNRLLFSK